MVSRRTKMNLGFYIFNTSNSQLNTEVYNTLNEAVEKDMVDDASLFYNEVDFNPNATKFGLFNSTELWSFSGTLVVTSLNLLRLASSVVNKIKLIFLYTEGAFERGKKDSVMGLLSIPSNVTVITKSEEDAREYKRLTGKEAKVIGTLNAKKVLEV